MNGIFVVDKPAGFTSFDVVAKMRGICATKKIGHGGTLDPMATGVLPVFVGRAAKAVDLQPRQDKTYEAVVLFGVATDTGDVTGEVLRRDDVAVGRRQVEAALPAFVGTRSQLPPMYSAVKLDGKPLYKYARAGEQVERKPREIAIHGIEYLGEEGENRHKLRVHCSKGTYIRVLAEELGDALGAPATLAALRRTGAGAFGIGQAHTLDEIQAARDEGRLHELLLPLERVFEDRACLTVDDTAAGRLLNGAPVYRVRGEPGCCRIHTQGGTFLGIGTLREDGTLQAEKLFCERD